MKNLTTIRTISAFLAFTALAPAAFAQTLLSGNHSMSGKLCVGPSCTATEDYPGNYPLNVKSPTTGIYFEDTSSPPFPFSDWEIKINDDANGGANYFAIRDPSNGANTLRIDNNAPDNSIYVADDGRVGFGTSIPLNDLHIVAPNFPSLRLEQDTSGGNPAASWRIQGNHNEFTIANTAAIFTIAQGAPFASMRIASDGDVGIGTSIPAMQLHLQRTDGTAGITVENTNASPSAVREMFKMSNNGGSYFTLDNTQSGTEWFFVHEDASPNRFIITDGVNDGPEMTISADGDLTIEGQLFTAGSCAAGCDRVFDANYPLPTIAQQADMMRALKHLPNVGPTPEDGPFNITAMTGGMLNELEKAHLYIAELNERDRDMALKLAAQNREIAELRALIETPK